MRVLLSTIGSRGDVQPLVALALALRARGHEIRLCVPPDFRAWLDGLGLAVTPIGPELRTLGAARPAAAGASPGLTPEQRRQLAEASVAAQFRTIADAAAGCDVIVAASALQIAARSVAEHLGARYVFVAYSPNVYPSTHHAPPPLPPVPGQPIDPVPPSHAELWARDRDRFNALFGPALNAHRAGLGLAAVDDVRRHVFGDRPWLAADPTLGPWPDGDGAVRQTGAWLLADDRPLPPDLEAFLAAGEPPVYIGFGSMRVTPDTGAALVGVARALGRRAIVSRGWADLAVDGAADCLTIDDVNQQALFPRVAAVVHHGGAGTTTVAALGGAPQVIAPQLYDQHYWAGRVRDLGIGAALPAGPPSPEAVRAGLEAVLAADVLGRAREVAPRIRRDGARVAADWLVDQEQR